jgi:hypothetical protein
MTGLLRPVDEPRADHSGCVTARWRVKVPGRRWTCAGALPTIAAMNGCDASPENLECLVEFSACRSTRSEKRHIHREYGTPEMKFICLGYADPKTWETLPEQELNAMMEECFAYDDELRRGGHFIGGEALQGANTAVTLRFADGDVNVTDGPYAETKEQLGGILLLEARDLNHAIALMSRHPGVRVGPFEIRPADETVNQLIAHRDEEAKAKS